MHVLLCLPLLSSGGVARGESEAELYAREYETRVTPSEQVHIARSDARLARFVAEKKICLDAPTYISLFRWETPLSAVRASVAAMVARGWNATLVRVRVRGQYEGQRADTGDPVCRASALVGLGEDTVCGVSLGRDDVFADFLLYHCHCFFSLHCETEREVDLIRVAPP